ARRPRGGHRTPAPVRAAQRAAQAFLDAVDVGIAAADGAGDLAEMRVSAEEGTGGHVLEEPPPPRVGKWPCEAAGEGVRSLANCLGQSVAGHWRLRSPPLSWNPR